MKNPVGQNRLTSIEALMIKPGDKLSISAYGFTLPFRIRLGNQYSNASIIGKSTGEVSAAMDSQTSDKQSSGALP